MIRSFADEGTEDLYNGIVSKKAMRIPKDIWPSARRKLDKLNYAGGLQDLMVPAGNRLEKLEGRLSGCYSIRVNDQFRVVFRWLSDGAHDVQIVDYH